mgnify:FL=1
MRCEDSKYAFKEKIESWIHHLYEVMLLETNVWPIEILVHYAESIDTSQKSRVYQIIYYHILLGILDVNYKRITRANFSHLFN